MVSLLACLAGRRRRREVCTCFWWTTKEWSKLVRQFILYFSQHRSWFRDSQSTPFFGRYLYTGIVFWTSPWFLLLCFISQYFLRPKSFQSVRGDYSHYTLIKLMLVMDSLSPHHLILIRRGCSFVSPYPSKAGIVRLTLAPRIHISDSIPQNHTASTIKLMKYQCWLQIAP